MRCLSHVFHLEFLVAFLFSLEFDHQDAIKGFQSGSTMVFVMRCLTLIDSLTQSSHEEAKTKHENLGWSITDTDVKHILPASSLILGQGGLSCKPDRYPQNVYVKQQVLLPQSILDRCSEQVEIHKIYKYLQQEELYGVKDWPGNTTYVSTQKSCFSDSGVYWSKV